MPDVSSGGGGDAFSVGFTEVFREKLGVSWSTAAFNIKINVFVNVFLTSDRLSWQLRDEISGSSLARSSSRSTRSS